MPVNKVVYAGETLIDLTDDTVEQDALLDGDVAHRADGTIVTGRLFHGLPEQETVWLPLHDSNGQIITGSDGAPVRGGTLYRRL